jgi:hypothetical protein
VLRAPWQEILACVWAEQPNFICLKVEAVATNHSLDGAPAENRACCFG